MSGKIKGGYKNVSLKGVDLIGASPEVDGLYDALINSYDKPIQLCNIIIDGVKKKNAFVQVKKDGNYVIVENLYGYKLTIGSDNAIGVSDALPEGLPEYTYQDVGKILTVESYHGNEQRVVWANNLKSALYMHKLTFGSSILTIITNNSQKITVTTSGSTHLIFLAETHKLINCYMEGKFTAYQVGRAMGSYGIISVLTGDAYNDLSALDLATFIADSDVVTRL